MSDQEHFDEDDEHPGDEYFQIESPLEPPADIGDEDEDLVAADTTLPPSVRLATTKFESSPRPHKKKKMSRDDKRRNKLDWPESLPYETETLEEFDARLDFVRRRLVQCVETRDYDIGLSLWTNRLQFLMSLKYPMQREARASLASLYYNIVLLPGCNPRIMDLCAGQAITLLAPKRLITRKDLTLPWRPLLDILRKQLFPKARVTGHTSVSTTLLALVETAQRFFPPSEAEAMLEEILPSLDGSSLDSVISVQAFLVHFLPLDHPQKWLPTMFRLWETFNSLHVDEQMLDLISRLCEHHTDPSSSGSNEDDDDDDDGVADESGDGNGATGVHAESEPGIWKDVGLLTSGQFAMVMTKALRSAGLPVGVGNRLSGAQAVAFRHGSQDHLVAESTLEIKKPSNSTTSLANIIVYSMAKDSLESVSQSQQNSGQSTPLAPSSSQHQERFLAGSKSLDALARYLQATEQYFHPSNWGHWSPLLTSFVSEIAAIFYRRWHDERRRYCQTPSSRRLTDGIKREFVLAARNVCLVAMFGKDPLSIAHTQKALKRMALLEPELVMETFLSRSYEDLEDLETSHRTTSVLSALSSLSYPLICKDVYSRGPSNLPEVFIHCLPAIDPTDHRKTLMACGFVATALATVRLDDLTRPELFDSLDESDREPFQAGLASNDEATRSKAEEALAIDDTIRFSTNAYEDWCIAFMDRVLLVCKSLPEEGARGKIGEKQEEALVHALGAAVQAVTESLSPHLFKRAFDRIYQHCAEEPSSNAVRVVGSLLVCFARIDSVHTLDRLVPLSVDKIRAEIEHGASSRRTTSTYTGAPGDMRLHWYLMTLIGAVNGSGAAILRHGAALRSTLGLLIERAHSERGYVYTARLMNRLVNKLCSVYPEKAHPLNQNEWNDPKTARNAHRTWGKMYKAREVEYEWHVPTQSELEFALQLVRDFVSPAIAELESMQSVHVEQRDKIWSNDFCRRLSLVRATYEAMAGLLQESDAGGGQDASDVGGQECMDFIEAPPRIKSGFVLTDHTSPQYRFVADFRAKVGAMLYNCAKSSRTSEAEDKQDCTKLLIRSIRTYMIEYSYSSSEYHRQYQAFSYFRTLFKLYPRQEAMPRLYWFRRAAFYHASRGRWNSYFRRRTELDDKLIKEVILEYCMSSYVGVRKTAQNSLDTIVARYDGTASICMPQLLAAVSPNVDDDRMKGALYVLLQKSFAYMAATDARLTAPYVLCLLNAHHHPKPSLQNMVRRLLAEFTMRFAEPSALRFQLQNTPELLAAAKKVRDSLPNKTWDQAEEAMLDDVRAQRDARVASIQLLHSQFTPEVLAVAQDGTRHWSIRSYAARMLRPLVRRDLDLLPELTTFFAEGILDSDKSCRAQHTAALCKTLYYIKLRTLAKNDEDLVRGKGTNPLKKEENWDIPVTSTFAQSFFANFMAPIDVSDRKMRDRTGLGWLAWGSKKSYYELPSTSEPTFEWEQGSRAAVEALRTFVTNRGWWDELFAQLSQEKDRKIGVPENSHLFKGCSQIFGVSIFEQISPIIEEYARVPDRHKHRAAAEALSGLLRGSKHWPLDHQKRLLHWAAEQLAIIFRVSTHDTAAVWQEFLIEVLRDRDPRRVAPLVEFIFNKATDYLSGGGDVGESIAVQTRAHMWLCDVVLTMDRKILAKSNELSEAYWRNIDTPYSEVRVQVVNNVKALDDFQLAPSYGSIKELMSDSLNGVASPHWQEVHAMYSRRFGELKSILAEALPQRTPTSQGTSKYDNVAMYAVKWMIAVCGDWRVSPVLEVAIDFLPSVFQMLEIKDNTELAVTASAFLTRITARQWGPGAMPRKLIRTLIRIIEESKDSWRTRLEALAFLQIAYFDNLFYLDAVDVKMIVDMLLVVLTDSRTEVREIASASLSGIVRSSQRQLISELSKRFTHTVVTTEVPARGQDGYADAVVRLHSGILGCVALVNAFPYEVPAWMPSLLVDTLCQHTDAPPPVNTTIKNCARDFKRTHQDNWTEQSKAFTSDQLAEVNAWALGRSDYFV